MKNIIYSIFYTIICTTIICLGFYIVDKSFNSMINPEGDFKMLKYVFVKDNYIEGEVMNESFKFNTKVYTDFITKTKEVFNKQKNFY